MSILIVTGTDTGVGKTIATAALALQASKQGSTLVIKPTQTGTATNEPTDAEEVSRLSGVPALTLVSLPDPLAPDTAARLRGFPLPTVADHAAEILRQAESHDTVIVEGAGGLLVRLDRDGNTLADLATALPGAEVVLVTSLKLGTLNHTALTLEALSQRSLSVRGLVIGSVPDQLDLAEANNLDDLRSFWVPILARISAGAGSLSRDEFDTQHDEWFATPSDH